MVKIPGVVFLGGPVVWKPILQILNAGSIIGQKNKTKEKFLMIKWLLGDTKRHLSMDCVVLQVLKKKKRIDRCFSFSFETEGIKNPGAIQ